MVYHRATCLRAYHQPFGLYIITRQRVLNSVMMIYKAFALVIYKTSFWWYTRLWRDWDARMRKALELPYYIKVRARENIARCSGACHTTQDENARACHNPAFLTKNLVLRNEVFLSKPQVWHLIAVRRISSALWAVYHHALACIFPAVWCKEHRIRCDGIASLRASIHFLRN